MQESRKPGGPSMRRRGVAVLLMSLTLVFVIGMVGLGTDMGLAYLLKARLSQAVDAGALAGARSLARGQDLASQTASATATAANFFSANFPNNFWGCTVAAPTIAVTEDTTYRTRYVTINASITAPLYFLRALGYSTINLSASGQAARRDVNIMLIIDRSSSMNTNGAMPPTIAAAKTFVGEFAPQRDVLGMVVFGGDYYLYPPTSNFGTTSSDPLVNEINNIKSNGNTNAATALWVAYQALANLNQPGALNVIVFFTDGLPNGVTADMIHTVTPSTGVAADYRQNPASCGPANVGTPAAPPANVMVGWFAQWSGFAPTGTIAGFYKYQTTTVGDTQDGSQPNVLTSGTTYKNCKFTADQTTVGQDFKQFPAYDWYGTPTWDDPKKASYLGAAYNTITQADLVSAMKSSPQKLGYASQNAADFAAQRWRHGDINAIVPLVYGITLTQAIGEKPDPMFMLRVTNTPVGLDNNGGPITNDLYDKNKPTGTYIMHDSAGSTSGRVLQLASQILHLSH